MLFHFDGTYPDWASSVLNYGNMGCELFIFASGFSLYFTMQKKPTMSDYIGRRLIRVLLPVVLMRSWEWIPQLVTGKIDFLLLISRWMCFQFWVSGEQTTWFFSFILIAYLLYPFVYSFLFESKGIVWLRTLVLVLFAVTLTLIINRYAPQYYDKVEIALTRFPVFFIGCAFGRIVYEKKTVQKNVPLLMFLLCGIVIVSFIMLRRQVFYGMAKRYFYIVPGVALSVLLPYIFAAVHTKWEKSGFFFRFLGKCSLELYLLHIMLGYKLLPELSFFDDRNVIHWLFMLVGCIAISYPVHKLITMISSYIVKKR